jgi:hypothetical protein
VNPTTQLDETRVLALYLEPGQSPTTVIGRIRVVALEKRHLEIDDPPWPDDSENFTEHSLRPPHMLKSSSTDYTVERLVTQRQKVKIRDDVGVFRSITIHGENFRGKAGATRTEVADPSTRWQ